jgi:transposase-like protein
MRKQVPPVFKAQVVQDFLGEEESIAQLTAEYGAHPTQLGKWKATAHKGLPSLFAER